MIRHRCLTSTICAFHLGFGLGEFSYGNRHSRVRQGDGPMILAALRLFRSLSGYHHRTILLTVLLPAIGPPAIAYFAPTSIVLQVVLYVAAFLVWSVLAMLAVASMLRRDRFEAEQLIAQRLETLSSQISRLREEHEDLRAGLRQQVKDLEEAVRATLKEELGVVLPPLPISIRARFTAGSATLSAAVTVVGGSKLARVRRWFRRATRWSWEVVYGKPEDR